MARRGQNEGTIVKRSDGRWVAALNLGYQDGKRKRKWYYGKTRKEVQEALTAGMRDLQRGLPVTTTRLTVGQFLALWLEESVRLSPKPMTYRTHASRIKNHLMPAFGRIALGKLAPADVQSFIARQTAKGLAPSTINGHLATLTTAINQAVKWELIPRNVVVLVNAPREQKKDRRVLTPQEMKQFLIAARGHRLEPLFLTLLTTGLRRGEARGLTWDCIDFTAATLTVRQQMQRVKGGNQSQAPKTRTSNRAIALSPSTLAALIRQRQYVADERTAMGVRWQENNLVFPSPKGKPFSESTLTRELDTLLENAKLPRMTPHHLRHCMASFCAAANINPRLTMDAMGHATTDMTMEVYQHVTDTMRREVATGIERLLFDGE